MHKSHLHMMSFSIVAWSSVDVQYLVDDRFRSRSDRRGRLADLRVSIKVFVSFPRDDPPRERRKSSAELCPFDRGDFERANGAKVRMKRVRDGRYTSKQDLDLLVS